LLLLLVKHLLDDISASVFYLRLTLVRVVIEEFSGFCFLVVLLRFQLETSQLLISLIGWFAASLLKFFKLIDARVSLSLFGSRREGVAFFKLGCCRPLLLLRHHRVFATSRLQKWSFWLYLIVFPFLLLRGGDFQLLLCLSLTQRDRFLVRYLPLSYRLCIVLLLTFLRL